MTIKMNDTNRTGTQVCSVADSMMDAVRNSVNYNDGHSYDISITVELKEKGPATIMLECPTETDTASKIENIYNAK